MSFTLDQLNAFSAAVEYGSFAQAAKTIGKHPSTVSQLVSNLEIDLGIELFTRHARSLEPTEHGNALYQYAQAVLLETDQFEKKAESCLQGLPPKVTIAIDSSLLDMGVPSTLERLMLKYPSLDLTVLNGDTYHVRHWILTGRAELGIALSTYTYPQDLGFGQVLDFKLCHVMTPKLAQANEVFTHTDVEMSQIRSVRQIVLHAFTLPDVEITQKVSNHSMVAGNVQFAKEFALQGLGWATLPLCIAQPYIDNGDLLPFNLKMESTHSWSIDAFWQSGSHLNPALMYLLNQFYALPNR